MIGRPSPSASAREAKLCRMSWMRTSWSPACARIDAHDPSMSVMCVPGLAPGMTQRLPGLGGRATGDGALGFWKALREVYGTTREQRCWVHKTANVLNKLPKSVQPRAKQHLQDIWMAETRAVAEKAFDFFLEAYGPKYDKAVACLAKDRDVLLAFYDFPAEHWKHIRTTNPIESTFATVRLRTTKTKGCLSRMTALTMVFKLCQSASKKWRRLDGSHQIADIIQGVKFKDGEKLTERAA